MNRLDENELCEWKCIICNVEWLHWAIFVLFEGNKEKTFFPSSPLHWQLSNLTVVIVLLSETCIRCSIVFFTFAFFFFTILLSLSLNPLTWKSAVIYRQQETIYAWCVVCLIWSFSYNRENTFSLINYLIVVNAIHIQLFDFILFQNLLTSLNSLAFR